MGLISGIIIGLIVLVILVVVHELGHAIVARRNGVVVEEFGIGFPPKAWGKKLKNGILFSINWLPLGGFVKLQGEHDSASKKGDYGAATFWQKTKILFAGVFTNWIVAILILTVVALFGMPKIVPGQFAVASDAHIISGQVQIGSLTEGYPAEKAGIESGDKILSIAGHEIKSVEDFIQTTQASRGQLVEVVYERDGYTGSANVQLRDEDSAVFGASLGQQQKVRSTWSAPIVGAVTTVQFTWLTLQGLGQLIGDLVSGLFMQLSPDQAAREQASANLDRAASSVAGPVGILGVIFPAAGEAGFVQVLFLAGIISLTLAVMNMLPIPALDGGRWFVTAIFRLLKKPLTKEKEEKIQGTGFLVLIGLIILVTIGDVAKLFQ